MALLAAIFAWEGFKGVGVKPLSSQCVVYFDFIRFSLAQIVVVGHGFGFFFGYWDGFFPLQVPYIQSIAVVGFFFVSGFLICRSVQTNFEYKGGDYVRYFVERFARIYTTLLPCLVFVWFTDYVCSSVVAHSNYKYSLAAGTFLKNLSLIPSLPYGTMSPVWSLMYEWWLYILFGGIVFFRRNIILSLVFVLVGGYYTFRVNSQGEAGHLEVIWFLGAVSAYFFDRLVWVSRAKYIALSALLVAVIVYLKSLNAYNLVAGVFFSIGLLFFAVAFNTNKEEVRPNLTFVFGSLAGYSFTLFLTHYTVLFWLQKSGFSGGSGLGVSLLFSNVVAYSIGRFTERYHKAISGNILRLMKAWRSKLVYKA